MSKLSTELRQEQISRAVLKIIAEQGLDGVKVSAVAQEIGVVPSALYRHFAGKEKMVLAALDMVRNHVEEAFAKLESMELSPLDWLDALVRIVPRMFSQTVVIPRIVFGTSSGAAQQRILKYVTQNLHKPMIERIADRFAAAQQAGQVKPELDVTTLALMYFGLYLTAMIRWYVSRGEFEPAQFVSKSWVVLRAGIVIEGGERA